MLTSRGRKGLPEAAPPAWNAAFVLCPPLEIVEPARLPTYPAPRRGSSPWLGPRPPRPLNPPARVARPTGQTSRWCIDREQMVSRRGKRGSTMKPYWSYCSFYLLRLQLGAWGFSANNVHPPPAPPLAPVPVIAAFCGERSASLHPAHPAPALLPLLLKSCWKDRGPKGAHHLPTPHGVPTFSSLDLSPSCPLCHLAEGWGDCEGLSVPAWPTEAQHPSLPHWTPLFLFLLLP